MDSPLVNILSITSRILFINPLVPNPLFLHLLKTSKSWCFQGVKKWCIGNKWVKFWNSDQNFNENILTPTWNSAWTNYDYSLLHTIYRFFDTIWSWNSHFVYFLVNKVGQWFQKNILLCKLRTVLLPNLLRPNFNFKAYVEISIQVRSCTPEISCRKIQVTTFMKASIEPISRGILKVSFKLISCRKMC